MNESLNLNVKNPEIKNFGLNVFSFLKEKLSLLANTLRSWVSDYLPQEWLINIFMLFISIFFLYLGTKLTNKILKVILWILGGILIFGIFINLV